MEWLILLAVLAVCGVGEQLQRIANAIQTKHQPQEPQEDPYGPLLDTIERERWHRSPAPPRRERNG